MRILISGICGFVGSTLAQALQRSIASVEVLGFDNFIRPGSEINRSRLRDVGIRVFHADVRVASDMEALPAADWLIDAAANPSVLAGIDGSSSRQVMEHNLSGTINLLEYCKRHLATFTLLSTSRVYSIPPLATLPVVVEDNAYTLDTSRPLPTGASQEGISEAFSTQAPVSLYGSTKLASEVLALEYGQAFSFPVWINRCGVLAGAGQFGRADQGIFSFWINSWLRRRPLKYIGFGGMGHQVRDCLHPQDLVSVLHQQFDAGMGNTFSRVINLSGGAASAMSLAQLSAWCSDRFGWHSVASDPVERAYDIGWMVLDSSLAADTWSWRPATSNLAILEEIALHAEANPHWLETSAP